MEAQNIRIHQILQRDGWTCSPEQLTQLAISRMKADQAFFTTAKQPRGHTQSLIDQTVNDHTPKPKSSLIIWITPLPLRVWLPENNNRHLLLPDCEISNFLITRLPLRMERAE